MQSTSYEVPNTFSGYVTRHFDSSMCLYSHFFLTLLYVNVEIR